MCPLARHLIGWLVLGQLKKTGINPDMTEKYLTGTYSFKTSKQNTQNEFILNNFDKAGYNKNMKNYPTCKDLREALNLKI